MARSYVLLVVVALFSFGVCSVQAVNWPVLTNQTISAVPPQEFRTLNSTTLKTISPTAMSGLLPAQMIEIPPSALQGLTKKQMQNIRGLVCAVFTVEQSANLAPLSCRGFEPECIRSLSVQALSAFTLKCIAEVPNFMIPLLSTQQFTAIQPSALRGLDCDQMWDIGNHIMEAITPVMLSNLSRACCFVNGRSVHHMKEETIKSMTSSCIEMADGTIFESIGLRRFVMIPKRAYSGIRYDQAMKMDKRIVDSLTLEDLLDTLSGAGMVGLLSSHSHFRDLINRYGMSLVRNLTVEHIYPEDSIHMAVMRQSVGAAHLDPKIFVVHWEEIRSRLESTNWLEVYLLSSDTPASVFTDHTVAAMMEYNFFGLTLDMFKKVPPHMFKHATADGVRLWPQEFVVSITLEIFKELSVDAFLELYEDLYHIRADWVSSIPIAAIPRMQFWGLYCAQAYAFTPEQIAVMTPSQLELVQGEINWCTESTAPRNTPISGTPVQDTPLMQETPAFSAPVNQGVVEDKGLTVGGVFAIIFAIAVVIQSSVIGYHIYNKRKRGSGLGQYDQL